MSERQKINPAVLGLKPSGIRRFFDLAEQIPDAISLGVGEPDFVTPWSIRNAAIRSLQRGRTAYTSNRGLKELREKICEYLKTRFSLCYDPEETIVTVGASEAIDVALRTLVSYGDEVLVPDPSYVSYVPGITLAGGVPVPVKTYESDDFALNASELEKAMTEKSKVLILPYPNNPTGAVMDEKQIREVARVVKKYDLTVISDEIYAELTYMGKHCSICALPDMKERCVLISGFSKAFAMTGWRIGYLAAPKEMSEQMLKIHQYTIMCAPTFSQYGALQALEDGKEDGYASVEYMRSQYDMRRRYLTERLNNMGLSCFLPRGAFYAFPCVGGLGMDGEEFARRLLTEKKVAVVPGSAFGECGRDYVRCSYACSLSSLKTACDRMEEFVSKDS